MIIKPVLFSVKNDVKIKQLKDFFKTNRNKNCIIKFENNDNPDEDFIYEIQKLNTYHKKTIVITLFCMIKDKIYFYLGLSCRYKILTTKWKPSDIFLKWSKKF